MKKEIKKLKNQKKKTYEDLLARFFLLGFSCFYGGRADLNLTLKEFDDRFIFGITF